LRMDAKLEIMKPRPKIVSSYLNSFASIRAELHILPLPKTVKGEELRKLRRDLLDIEAQAQMFLNHIDGKGN